MRKRIAFWSLWLISRLAVADSPEEERFLATPEAIWSSSPAKAVVFRFSEMDPQLIEVMAPFFTDSPNVDGSDYSGFKLDLGGDGDDEYFIRTPLGGTGGPHHAVFTKEKQKWVCIADFQGSFHLLPGEGKWRSIVGYVRGGAKYYYKFRLDYDKGRYQKTWAAIIESGIVKEVDPSEGSDSPD